MSTTERIHGEARHLLPRWPISLAVFALLWASCGTRPGTNDDAESDVGTEDAALDVPLDVVDVDVEADVPVIPDAGRVLTGGPFPMALLLNAEGGQILLLADDLNDDGIADSTAEIRIFANERTIGMELAEVAPLGERAVVARDVSGVLLVLEDTDADGVVSPNEVREIPLTGGGTTELFAGPIVGPQGWVYGFNRGGAGERFFFRMDLDDGSGETLWHNFGVGDSFDGPWLAPSTETLLVYEVLEGNGALVSVDLLSLERTIVWEDSSSQNIGDLAQSPDGSTAILMQPNLGWDLVALEDIDSDGQISDDERRVLVFAAGSSSIYDVGVAATDEHAFFIWDDFRSESEAAVYRVPHRTPQAQPVPVVLIPESLGIDDGRSYPSRTRSFAATPSSPR